jgi:2-polyprenyl-3-methyl-5-hydroxy-6-metoxy-1,4-benzoquinol methylase
MDTLIDYGQKAEDYFAHARTEIAPLLPAHGDLRVLEVGCGDGSTLAWLKRDGHCAYGVGIELHTPAAALARSHCDRVIVGDAEWLLDQAFECGPFDLVLCLDVLEHMVDPWQFLRRLGKALQPGAQVIASVPNVRHYKVSLPLLFNGRFEYETQGVLDQTHLRFFTRHSASRLLSKAPYRLTALRPSRPPAGSPSWIAHVASLGLLGDLFAVQFLLSAQRV